MVGDTETAGCWIGMVCNGLTGGMVHFQVRILSAQQAPDGILGNEGGSRDDGSKWVCCTRGFTSREQVRGRAEPDSPRSMTIDSRLVNSWFRITWVSVKG